MITSAHRHAYERDGFAIVEQAFTAEEVVLLDQAARTQERIKEAHSTLDKEGRESKISITTEFSDDVWGYVSRMPRVVRGAEILLGESVYHWHSKIMVKEARQGGAWEWHQDYGYWYRDDPPFPQMISAMIAVTEADRKNGCLRVLRGSHRCGRLDHGKIGSQTGADPERVEALLKRLQVVDCVLRPGDMLFFHCNLLHASEPNVSDRPRTSYICCYNALNNPPLTKPGHGPCVPLELVADNLDTWK
jgi:hypothetical protein